MDATVDAQSDAQNEIQLTPTLVIGVGGTGSEIAGRLYREGRRKRLDQRRLLTVLALDTDDIDHRRLDVSDANKVRFSSATPISDLMKRNPEIQGRWLYSASELSAEIRNLTLISGAGQVRMFTRLALHDALKFGNLELNLRTNLLQLAQVSNQSAYEGRINVLILGSLAGGTGCGSFLQIALICREIARSNNIQKLDIRGMFLLPDVYVYGAGMAHDHIRNVTANATAAFRELNAATQVTAGHLPLDAMNFEFMPGKNLTLGQMPYDLVTLIDFEMINGQNLGPNIDHYKDLMARAAHTSLFLPIGQKFEQRQVNSVQDKLSAIEINSTKNFASTGVFAITYPEDAILSHLTDRFASEVLEGDWLVLDRAFRRRVDVYEDRRRAGDTSVQYPGRGDSFIGDLAQMARDRRPLFTDIQANVYREIQTPEGRIETRIVFEDFLNAFLGYVRAQFREATEPVRNAYGASKAQPGQFENREDLPDIVQRRENALNLHWRTMEDAARQVPDGIYDNYWLGGLAMDGSEWQAHHLQRYLVAQAPHLVEVRYFLYLAKREIEKRLKGLNPEKIALDVTQASAPFEDDRKPAKSQRAGQGPINRATEVADEGRIGRIFSSKAKTFVQAYMRYHDTSLDNLRLFGEETAVKRCLERLDGDIGQLLRLLELLFADLESLQGELKVRIAEDMDRHSSIAGAVTGNRFVYAGRRAKETMWDDIKPNAQGQKIGREANSRMIGALFAEVRKQREQRRAVGAPKAGGEAFNLRGLFQEEVMQKFCRQTLLDSLGAAFSFDVAEAIKREAQLNGQDFETFASEVVRVVGKQAKPFILLDSHENGSELIYWAMHPRSKEALVKGGFFDRLFRYEESINAVDGSEYDHRQLLCVDVRYNFPILSVLKLKPGDRDGRTIYDAAPGRYDKFYRDAIDKVIESDAKSIGRPRAKLTPHLDREWHKPAGLPEIFPEIEDDKVDTFYEDFAIAFGMRYLRRETDGGDPAIAFYDPTRLEHGDSRSIVTLGQAIDRLLADFKSRPDLAMAARSGFNRALELSRAEIDRGKDHKTLELYSSLAAPEPLSGLLEIARNRSEETDRDVARVVRAYFNVLRTALRALRPDLEPRRLDQLFDSLAGELLDSALAGVEGKLNRDTFERARSTAGNVLKGLRQGAAAG